MIEHRLHRLTPIAHGTGGHTHHRAFLEHDGIRVAFWRCQRSTAPTHACPDEPDPWVRWAEKVMERQATRRPAKPKTVCDRHDPARWRTYSEHAGTLCLDCRSEKRRFQRAARRIAKEAVAAA